jgi:hypothetical protein
MICLRAIVRVAFCATLWVITAVARAETTKATCIDANTRAQSLRREGRFSDARASLRECLDVACPLLVRSDCAQRLDDLDREQPTLIVHAEDPSGRDISDVKITVDGQLLTAQAGATAISLDPGAHRVLFESPGWRATARTFVMSTGEKGRRERVVLERPAADAGEGGNAHPHSNLRPIGLAVGGVGLAAMAAGATFAALARIAQDGYAQHCGINIGAPPSSCDAQGIRGHDDALAKANLATAFLVAGGSALLGAGVILVFAATPGRTGVTMTLGQDGVSVSERF